MVSSIGNVQKRKRRQGLNKANNSIEIMKKHPKKKQTKRKDKRRVGREKGEKKKRCVCVRGVVQNKKKNVSKVRDRKSSRRVKNSVAYCSWGTRRRPWDACSPAQAQVSMAILGRTESRTPSCIISFFHCPSTRGVSLLCSSSLCTGSEKSF